MKNKIITNNNDKGKQAERLVHSLAIKTFLTDWCYLNPKLPDDKELCDLLIIFDDIAIIWQIKDLKLNAKERYKEREVKKNLRQLSGAFRQLFTLKTEIKLENPRRGIEVFKPGNIKEIYLISVLLGEGEISFPIIEKVGGHLIHIFNKNFLEIILEELDTIDDFIKYIRIKEEFIKLDKRMVIIGGEEELLAYYIGHDKSLDEFQNYDDIIIDEGGWIKLRDNQKYKQKKKDDEISYGWDDIINRIHECSPKYEIVARELARPNRFYRRVLGKVYYEAMVMADKDKIHNIYRRFFDLNDTTYCFLFTDNKKPRTYRQNMLQWMCFVARGKFQSNKKVIGIATEKEVSPTCSYDFVLLDIPVWTDDNQKEMELAQNKLGILVNPSRKEINEDEYSV